MSSFIAFFYLMPCCWADRQQYKAKHISHWKYLPRPSSESILFLLQLYLTQRHIHETAHNFGYFEGKWKTSNRGKTSNRRKTSKKSRSRNTFFNCFHTEIKLYCSRKCSGCLNWVLGKWYDMQWKQVLFKIVLMKMLTCSFTYSDTYCDSRQTEAEMSRYKSFWLVSTMENRRFSV